MGSNDQFALQKSRTARLGRPLCANTGHFTIHSMTSSARASSGCGTVSPSAFAVLRLIIN
jgi:hypothetical protein